jgi:hypothetical protein
VEEGEGEEEVKDRVVEEVAEVVVSEGEEVGVVEEEVGEVEEEVGEVLEEVEEGEDGTDSYCTFTILLSEKKRINIDHKLYHPYWVLNCNCVFNLNALLHSGKLKIHRFNVKE